MITKEILESHPVTVLKKEISKTNIKGYSKMKKSEIVSLMLKPEHSKRFSHIKKKGEAPKPEKKIVIKRTPKPEKKIVIKKKPKATKKNSNDEAGPAKESTEEIIKKSRQVVHKDFTLNDLEKQLKFQKSIGNTASVEALEKEIKKFKGKRPAKK